MTSPKDSKNKGGTLLVLSTYPIRRARHGGQLRSAALMVEYKKSFSKVIRTAVFNSSVYSSKEFDKKDIPSPPDIAQQIVHTPELEAWILGKSPATSPEVRKRITHLVHKYNPEAILFEQPFLYLGMKELLFDLNIDVPLIYSSHNVETNMMKEIFTNLDVAAQYEHELNQLETVEKDLTGRALGTISVSKEDAELFMQWGATNVIVQGNGANHLKTSLLKRLRARRIMKKLGVTSYALYVGSSHRPNIEGFVKLLGTRFGFLPSNTMIFLAGDIARGLQPEVEKSDPIWGNLMWARVFNWDRVSRKTLSALIHEASCVILPITSGGGSNLKTAEALLAGKKVVATPVSVRGFTDYVESSFVSSDLSDANLFKSALCEALLSSETGTNKNQMAAQKLEWKSQLADLSNWLNHTTSSEK